MSKTEKKAERVSSNPKSVTVPAIPRSLRIFAGGLNTDKDYASAMSALMGDLIEGSVTPTVGNAVCKAGAGMLKVIELKYKYGSQEGTKSREKTLRLSA